MDIKRINQIAYQQMAQRKTHEGREPGFIFYHGRRVARLALDLADRLEGALDRQILYTTALFHDIGKGEEPHNETGARMVQQVLADVCQPQSLAQISELVRLHNQRKQPNDYDLSTRILQDADHLDHMGVIGTWLTLFWSGSHDETIDGVLAYFFGEENQERLVRLRKELNFEISVKLYDQRVAFERQFFTALRREQQEEKPEELL